MNTETVILKTMRKIMEDSPMRLFTARQPVRPDAHIPAEIPDGPIIVDYVPTMKPGIKKKVLRFLLTTPR